MTRDEYITTESDWLSRHHAAYQEGLSHLSNLDYVRGYLRGVEQKLSLALAYNPREDQPHVAVFILGDLQSKLERLLTEIHFIDDYEDRRDELDRFIKEHVESHEGQLDEERDDLS
jgi:hypothetical protein